MTPEQLKLLQQLAELGDVTYFKRNRETIVKAISNMDMKALEVILDESITYQDVSKKVFLNKLNELFKDLKKTDDYLTINDGKCQSDECPNKNKCGVLFSGNKSGNNFPLIIEKDENNNIKDLYYCNDFHCESDLDGNKKGKSLYYKIYEDEKSDFIPNANFEFINSKAVKALNEIKEFREKSIPKEELIKWVNTYADFFSTLFIFHLRYKNEELFYHCYSNSKQIVDFMLLEQEATNAVELFDTLVIDNEMNLLKWLSENEKLKADMMLFIYFFINEKTPQSKVIEIDKKLNISISSDYFKNCLQFNEIITNYYDKILAKYKVHNIDYNLTTDDGIINNESSLKFHLSQRGVHTDAINYSFNPGKNSFLYDAPNLGQLEKGVSYGDNNDDRDITKKDTDSFEII
jgi:hypothetical protein